MPNISRKNMPQVDTQNLSKAINMVSAKVRVTKGKIAVGKLKKSQRELHRDKIEGIAARFTTPNKFKPLIISKDNHIVDGHHRWAAALYKWGTDVQIPIIRINLPINEAIELYKEIAQKLGQPVKETIKNEDITIPINIGDTILGGKFKNKRILVKSIDKNEKGDITVNGKPLLKFRLVTEGTGESIRCSNCNHNWEIEFEDDRPYLCHNCGYDSQIQKIDLVGLEYWKSSINEANAVSGGKVHKFITGKNLTFKGKKYSELYFEVLRIDNNSKLVTLKILSPKPLFGNEINVPFRTINRGPFLKTDTSGISEIDSDEETEGLPVIRRDGASNLNNSGQYSKVVEVELNEKFDFDKAAELMVTHAIKKYKAKNFKDFMKVLKNHSLVGLHPSLHPMYKSFWDKYSNSNESIEEEAKRDFKTTNQKLDI